MSEMWRVLDTGLRSAAQNIALNRALLEARRAEEIVSTLRFFRIPRSASLACDQSPAQELRLRYCKANGIRLQRRLTTGPAAYCDESQLGWELYLHRRDIAGADGRAVAKRICHAAAAALSALEIDARARRGDEIEVDGRTLARAGIAFDEDALLYQGMIPMATDFGTLSHVLRRPESWTDEEAETAARERMTDLRQLLGPAADARVVKSKLVTACESEFNMELHDGELSLTEHVRYQRALSEIDSPDWVNLLRQPVVGAPLCAGQQIISGGLLTADVIYDRSAQRIKQVWFRGDVDNSPRRVIADLEAALRGTLIDRVAATIESFFSAATRPTQGLKPEHFIAAIGRALRLPAIARDRR